MWQSTYVLLIYTDETKQQTYFSQSLSGNNLASYLQAVGETGKAVSE